MCADPDLDPDPHQNFMNPQKLLGSRSGTEARIQPYNAVMNYSVGLEASYRYISLGRNHVGPKILNIA
jgi:hypothetical protein